MSPSCSAEQRSHSIGQCVYAAQDTASIMSRTMLSDDAEWQSQIFTSATTLMCTHLWRCMLFLLFRQIYEPFNTLLQASACIGNRRDINISCGRYLLFFIERLIERYEQGAALDLEQDEEIIVYLSADLQAGTNSWVWGSAETGTLLSRRQKHGRPRHTSQEREQALATEISTSWDIALSAEEQRTWGGWQRIEQAAQHLRGLQGRAASKQSMPMRLALPPINQATELSRPSSTSTSATSPGESSRSRMNIASII